MFKAFLTVALLAQDIIHLLLMFSSYSPSSINGLLQLLDSSYSWVTSFLNLSSYVLLPSWCRCLSSSPSSEKQYNRSPSISFSMEVISGLATELFSNARGESRMPNAPPSILTSFFILFLRSIYGNVRKVVSCVLDSKTLKTVCTMVELAHADYPNLEDKQATILHNVHGRGQTSKEQ